MKIAHIFDEERYSRPIEYTVMVSLCGERFRSNEDRPPVVVVEANDETVDGVCTKCVARLADAYAEAKAHLEAAKTFSKSFTYNLNTAIDESRLTL